MSHASFNFCATGPKATLRYLDLAGASCRTPLLQQHTHALALALALVHHAHVNEVHHVLVKLLDRTAWETTIGIPLIRFR